MGKLGFLVKTSTMVYCDNQSVKQITKNLVTHSKMKHGEIQAHYFRQLVQENFVNPNYFRINDQVVDIFLNPLS